MGKLNYYIKQENQALGEFTISRSRLIEIVNDAVDEALGYGLDPVIAEDLRDVAKTTNQIDYGSFKCYGSCGCPLTKAGVVKYNPEREENTDLSYSHGAEFPGVFDALMDQEFGNPGPAIVHVR